MIIINNRVENNSLGTGTGPTPLIQDDAPIIFDERGFIGSDSGCMKSYKKNQVIVCKPGCM